MGRFVAYLRVSTSKQAKSGLGLAAQRSKISSFLTESDDLVAEFIETQSGKLDEREELWKAIRFAKRQSAKLVIAKLDRFSRKVSFISRIMDEGVGLAVADMPNATDFQLHIFAALAQEERRLISERTKAALAEAKKRGVKLGGNGKVLAKRNRENARLFARSVYPHISPMIEAGHSLSAIARSLNALEIESSRGGQFHAQTVKNIILTVQNRSESNAQIGSASPL